ncbi:Cu(I)/Ag(I) efflux system membrane fusion protein [Sinobacterium caligoides]|uniref:Cu(I)/Ag(I) efflux system membrane fusion protein n=1 Tax=Sinobacterium caligoides TaxID=933926 RepID=A0A3N2DYT6_9GAMM|nr:efflux RND transporter periplasmic adaptor subunit [Sinobacterium caligoides]ROS05013.1 Cu(I)/Ag(I) efflux system membrane fusion protein [Sinobacterium caligoides]
MKSLFIYSAFAIVGMLVGITLQNRWTIIGDAGQLAKEDKAKPLYWVAPMDANYRRDRPGKSPMGMDLVPVYEQVSDPQTVLISAAVEQNLAVRLGVVERRILPIPIQTVGIVQLDEDKIYHAHVRAEGWIQQLKATAVGDRVKAGELLFKLYSPTLVAAQEEYLVALNSGNHKLLSASKERLLALGISEQDITSLRLQRKAQQQISFYAHHDGFITKLAVREGMYVKPDSEIMAIGDLASVWVIAEVFERQAAWLKAGQAVEMTTISDNGRRWIGAVETIYPVLKKKTRTVQVRIRFDNSDFALKPNMFADLIIKAGDHQQRLLLPREAVIRGAQFNRVVKQVKAGEYRSEIVSTGIEAGAYVEILTGLDVGDKVVTSAQFLIDSESNIDAEIARINGAEQHEMTGGAMKVDGSPQMKPDASKRAAGKQSEMRCGGDMDMSREGVNHD